MKLIFQYFLLIILTTLSLNNKHLKNKNKIKN